MNLVRYLATVVGVVALITSPAWVLAVGTELGINQLRLGQGMCLVFGLGTLVCGWRMQRSRRV